MARTGESTKALLRLFESMFICPVRAIRFTTSIRLHFHQSDCSGPPRFQLPELTCNLEKEVRLSKRPM